MATRKVRYKKLNIKTALPVLREDQVDPNEYEALTTESQIATGVEQAEENEYHLQVVLQGAGAASNKKEIPVPPPQESDVNYDALYSRSYEQPTNYIRFSQTVEECIGCQYDMTDEDDEFLKGYNEKRPANARLSEDDFEQVMEVFEDTASISTPYASVDKTVVPYDHMVAGLHELQLPKIMHHAKDIYEWWKSRRVDLGGSLRPSVKFETHQDSDEMDPFVCFRRREVRQTRKTRARDIQSADKLKRLRRELEEGRQIVLMACQREVQKREMLRIDRAIYEQRAKLKETKIQLGIRTDDEDLINQKPQKKKVPDLSVAQRSANTQVRTPVRSEGRSNEMDLKLLADSLVENENELRADVIKRIENHRRWNENHIDLTCEPLGPVKDPNAGAGFRAAKTQYLMTPPASDVSNNEDEAEAMELDEPSAAPSRAAVFEFKGVALEGNALSRMPLAFPEGRPNVQFRRRIGRLNRLWIDRRRMPMASPPREMSPGADGRMDVDMVADRWKYDRDDSDEEPDVYEVDPYDTDALKFRASLPLPFPFQMRRQELPASAAVRVGGAGVAVAQQQGRAASGQQQQRLPGPPGPTGPVATAAPTVKTNGVS